MSSIIEFDAKHWDLFESRGIEQKLFDLDPGAKHKITCLAKYGVGGTLMHDGRILAFIGYIEIAPGVLEVWSFPSKYVDKYPIIYLKNCKEWVERIEHTTPNLHRLHLVTKTDAVHVRWAQFLGFTCESGAIKHYFADKSDAQIWGKVYV